MNNRQFVLVAGYGWTGSSALVDMLKEYDHMYEADVEFRLIKDPKGIADLYNNIVTKWDPLNVDIAIRDFLWLVNKLNKPKNKLSFNSGLGYCNYFGDNYLKASKQYLSDITDFKYSSFWWYLDFINTPFNIYKRKISKKLFKDTKNEQMFFSDISSEYFIEKTHIFITSLFEPIIDRDSRYIILDQAVSAQNCLQEMIFIPDSKVIIVDRDPRDIYADLMKDGNLIGQELKKSHDVNKYIAWHKALRKSRSDIKGSENVLFIRFEDLIYSYDETERSIEEFLGLSHDGHKRRKEIFTPEISAKNVGFWKNTLTSNELDIIRSNLKEDLYL